MIENTEAQLSSAAPRFRLWATLSPCRFVDRVKVSLISPTYTVSMVNEPALPTTERRRVVRQKSFLRGTIHFNNRRSAVDCLIRDISVHGARLIFSDAITTPDVVELYIPQKDQTVRAHVIWRHGQELGVAFAQTAPVEAVRGESGDLAERVAKLEAEVAALRRALRKIKVEIGPDCDA
jgi:hypothetical protein